MKRRSQHGKAAGREKANRSDRDVPAANGARNAGVSARARARILASLGHLFSQAIVDPAELLARISREVRGLDVDVCIVRLLGDGGDTLRIAAWSADEPTSRLIAAAPAITAIPSATEPFARVMSRGKVVVGPMRALRERLLDGTDPRVRHAADRERPRGRAAVLPLRARGRAIGTMTLVRYPPHAGFSGIERRFFSEIADRAAVAVDNARILASLEDANRRLEAREMAGAALAQERESLVRELREVNRRKDEFLSMLAHELRNPLAPMLSAAAILRGSAPGATKDRAAAAIDRQVRHMAALVDDLLDVSRIARGTVELHRAPVDLGVLIREVVADHTAVALASRVSFVADVPEEPVRIHGDRTRLAQMLSNLLGNAFKFTPAGGQVRVRLGLAAEGEDAEIVLEDSGIGIDPELLPHVFDAFTQADRSLDRTQGGLGLGLAVTRGLAELHGGTIRAESAGAGKGACFVIRLPLADHVADAPPEGSPARASFEQTLAPRRRVLVIDDNRDAADMLCELLAAEGHDVAVEYDSESALAAAHRLAPEIVLCDLGLPGKDGFALAREMRADPALAHTKIYAVSGYGAEEDRRRAREAGFDAHLTKPVDPDTLTRLLLPAA